MLKELKVILSILGALVVLVFMLFLVNQVLTFYHNLQAVDSLLAVVVTVLLTAVLLGLLIAPVLIYVRLPASMPFPDHPADLEAYHFALRNRLRSNPTVRELQLDPHNPEDYLLIQKSLCDKANRVINESATAVFLSTAISQNGKLDAFTVLAAQIRLIWKVAHIYWQRPSMKNIWQLYTHVAVNSMAAVGIEQLDLSRQIEPVISALLKSPARTIPIVGDAAHIVTDSILEGSINAFLTLRVGVLTRNYCLPDQLTLRDIRRNSFIEASGLLSRLVIVSSSKVIESLLKAGRNMGLRTLKSGYGKVGTAVKKGATGFTSMFEKRPRPGEVK
jgi:hypothetical protein